MRNTTIKYRVAPVDRRSGSFPIDMLRYDGAHPADEQQSHRIVDSFWYTSATNDSQRPAPSHIDLVATNNGCPNDARWRSFGWEVTHVWNGSQWEVYHSGIRGHRLVK